MRITSSQVEFATQYEFRREREVSERLQIRSIQQQGDKQVTTDIELSDRYTSSQTEQRSQSASVTAHLQQTIEKRVASLQLSRSDVIEKAKETPEVDEAPAKKLADDARLQILVGVIQRLTGREVKWFDSEQLKVDDDKLVDSESLRQLPDQANSSWGMRYERHQRDIEEERSEFSAKAKVATADGRSLDIELALSMSRRFVEENHLVVTEGEALKDPLVINFSGTAAELTERKFEFDIDADGSAESISFVTPQSGFIALDRNGDGVVNDGSELFGAMTGSGFGELAQYDEDGNNWIDEADSVFSQLRVWSKDAEGQDQLVALGYYNVGALYLGKSETPFDLTTEQNALLGKVRESGVYLEESGVAKTLQQVDLVI